MIFNSSKEKFEIFRVLGMNEVCNCSQITEWNSIMQFFIIILIILTSKTTNEIMKAF